MKWTDATPLPESNGVHIPDNWLFLHYYEALSILFRIENTLRTFVYVVLKDKHKDAWRTLSIDTDDGGQTNIDAAAKRRATQDATFGYLGYFTSSPLMHLTSGELIRLVVSDAYWPLFKAYFPATKSIVQTKLEEIGNVRNALAHFRPLKPDDVQVVRQNANQVLSRVEETLARLVTAGIPVPTNTTDPWYTEIKTLSAPNIKIVFQQSDDERWISLDLEYDCPVVGQPDLHKGRSFGHCRALTILTPPMLRAARVLRENTIFASEWVGHATATDDEPPVFSKTVHFYLSRESLGVGYQPIKAELENLVRRISDETELINEDNLARGEFVRAVFMGATRSPDKTRWTFTTSNLHSPISDTDPVEYWAGKPSWGSDFLTDTESFPWMPVNVSNVSLPF